MQRDKSHRYCPTCAPRTSSPWNYFRPITVSTVRRKWVFTSPPRKCILSVTLSTPGPAGGAAADDPAQSGGTSPHPEDRARSPTGMPQKVDTKEDTQRPRECLAQTVPYKKPNYIWLDLELSNTQISGAVAGAGTWREPTRAPAPGAPYRSSQQSRPAQPTPWPVTRISLRR